MSACPPREQIAAYLDGAATPETRVRIERHLDGCPACREFCEGLGSGGALFERLRDAANATTRPLPTAPADGLSPPERIGPYRLLERIGEGGFGEVYLAEQTTPLRRRVALKIIKPGMDSKQVIARFEAERQALAMMDHPHVAKVFEAGATPEGRPYFAMEYVAGDPITEHCDRQRLGIEARLALFVLVCDAVQHAHQKGIIHRDIKPSNILVAYRDPPPAPPPRKGARAGSSGEHGGAALDAFPKVIDFGVAKALHQPLTDKTLFTQRGQLIGTLEYMSPEQAESAGQAIDRQTDIYSLGVLLYELLSGYLPFEPRRLRETSLQGIVRMLREEDPPRPSTKLSTMSAPADPNSPDSATAARNRRSDPKSLARRLRGELDWITMKAMEKERDRRYATAGELAEDVRRFLAGEAIWARPPSAWYRLRKRARKQRRRIAVAVLLLVVVGVTSLFYSRAVARTRARLDAAAAILEAPSRPEEAITRLKGIVQEYPEFIEARIRLAYLLKRVNRYDEASMEAQAILKRHPDTGEAHLLLSRLYVDAHPERLEHHRQEAQRLLPDNKFFRALALPATESLEAVRLLTQVLEEDGTNFDARWERAWLYLNLDQFEQALKDAELLCETHGNLSRAWNLKGLALSRLRRLDEAIVAHTKALDISPEHARHRVNRADCYVNARQPQRALEDCNRAIEQRDDLAGAFVVRARARLELPKPDLDKAWADVERAAALEPENLSVPWLRGDIHRFRGEREAALALYDEALARSPRFVGVLESRARLLQEWERFEEAIETWTAHIAASNEKEAVPYYLRGLCLEYLDRFEAARKDFDRAVELEPQNPAFYFGRARLKRITGHYEQALPDHHMAIKLAPHNSNGYAGRAITLWLMSESEAALADLKQAIRLAGAETVALYLLVWEIRVLSNRPAEAAAALAAAGKAALKPSDREILAFVEGRKSAEELLTVSKSREEKCTAYYIMAVKALAAGRREEAKTWFEKCVGLRRSTYAEHDLASWHLAKLGGAAGSSSDTTSE